MSAYPRRSCVSALVYALRANSIALLCLQSASIRAASKFAGPIFFSRACWRSASFGSFGAGLTWPSAGAGAAPCGAFGVIPPIAAPAAAEAAAPATMLAPTLPVKTPSTAPATAPPTAPDLAPSAAYVSAQLAVRNATAQISNVTTFEGNIQLSEKATGGTATKDT